MDFKMWWHAKLLLFLAVIRLCNKYSWLICCHHLADTAYKICSTPILADSGHHNMIKSWKQNRCYPHAVKKKKDKRLHKRMTMVASVSIRIFIYFSHLLWAAPQKNLISQSLKSHLSRSYSAHLPSVHVTDFRGRPFYSVEATAKIHETWQWLMTRCQLTALTKDRALSLYSLYCHALTK